MASFFRPMVTFCVWSTTKPGKFVLIRNIHEISRPYVPTGSVQIFNFIEFGKLASVKVLESFISHVVCTYIPAVLVYFSCLSGEKNPCVAQYRKVSGNTVLGNPLFPPCTRQGSEFTPTAALTAPQIDRYSPLLYINLLNSFFSSSANRLTSQTR